MSRLISIIVPVFNEAQSVSELCARIRATMDRAEEQFELLFVDDGSTDGTAEAALRERTSDPRVGLIRHQKNHGKSIALMQGFQAARGDIAVTMDGDLQDVPEEIPSLVAAIDEGYDLVNGCRARRQDAFSRRAVSWVYNRLTNMMSGQDIHDINCGFKAMRRAVYKRLELRGDMHRLIPILAGVTFGFRVTEVAVVHAQRKHGTSRYRLLRHRGLLDVVSVMACSATRWRPFHVFVECSVVPLLMAVVLGVSWLLLQTVWQNDGVIHSVTSTLLLVGAACGLFIAPVMWLIGLLMEVLLAPLQGAQWYDRLIVDRVEPRAEASDAGTELRVAA
ncbi:MAG: glycosyltransferase [Phycisphaeraceae bacterium]|nr:glycosyltransferase [Phycisphaeraceae bacterium]